jgi:uncharacterized protein
VSNQLPTEKQALQILKEAGCSPKVIAHCKAVSKLAVEIAQKCQKKGLKVDVDLVMAGGLLHDLGRAKTHTVNHVVVGVEIARAQGVPESVVACISRHLGGGLTLMEAKKLGWPDGVYAPRAVEEKIVCYADKLIGTSRRIPIEKTINGLRHERLNDAADRVQQLHEEISKLVGDYP